ncbi:MAG: hypothetical protein NTV01_13635 [Bacteroidia bacterium]|nr:hypothetical protein [Bacteroidia bacterium]
MMVKSSFPYVIQVFIDGKLNKVINRNSPVFVKPELVETFFTPTNGPGGSTVALKQRSTVWRIIPLPDGRFVTFITDAGKNFKENSNEREFSSSIELFDKDGIFLKSYPWDWKKNGLLLHADSEGFFYSNFGETEDVTGVSKWKLTFN